MRAVFALVLVAGLGLAGFAVYMVQGYFEDQERALAQTRALVATKTPTVEVYAVNRDIAYGERISPEDVAVVQYAEPHLPEGVFRTEEELFPEGERILRSVVMPMQANEPVMVAKVTEPGQDAGITTVLDPGMRAFTISVDAASGVSGFLRPTDRVDVYWTGAQRDGGEVTRLIDTALEIIAVDQSADTTRVRAEVADTVTVQVTPQQVAFLAQAQATGSLSLSLVGLSDDIVASAIEVDGRDILGLGDVTPTVEVIEEAPEVCTIKTRRGSELVETVIPCS